MNRRRLLWGTLHWVEGMRCHLAEGDDLGRAWKRAYRQGAGELGEPLRWVLRPSGRPGGWEGRLRQAARRFPLPEYRAWFCAIEDLYRTGASLGPTLEAWAETLRRDWEQEWEAHVRETPVRVNLLMLLFFFPAAAVLLFYPLLAGLEVP